MQLLFTVTYYQQEMHLIFFVEAKNCNLPKPAAVISAGAAATSF
jgi:hypothetical protein